MSNTRFTVIWLLTLSRKNAPITSSCAQTHIIMDFYRTGVWLL